MNWFLYDNGHRHERLSDRVQRVMENLLIENVY